MLKYIFLFLNICISNAYVNFELQYQGNINFLKENSLRFSTAENKKYQIFNYYNYPLFTCLNLCEKIPSCKGVYYMDGHACIGLSYLGEKPHLTTKISKSYIKSYDVDKISNFSCYNRCDEIAVSHEDNICFCDKLCSYFEDCCSDFGKFCINHCYYNNGYCSDNCEMSDLGFTNCSCNSNKFLSNDGMTCNSELSISGNIYDNYHEKHTRNITLELSDGNNTYYQNINSNGEYSFNNLSNITYKLKQIIYDNCTQIYPKENSINITLPTNIEYDFENKCGLDCICDIRQYAENCNFDIGYSNCLNCNICDEEHILLKDCSKYENTICIPKSTTYTTSSTLTYTTTTVTGTTTTLTGTTTTLTRTNTTLTGNNNTNTSHILTSTSSTLTNNINNNNKKSSNLNTDVIISIVTLILILLLLLIISILYKKNIVKLEPVRFNYGNSFNNPIYGNNNNPHNEMTEHNEAIEHNENITTFNSKNKNYYSETLYVENTEENYLDITNGSDE